MTYQEQLQDPRWKEKAREIREKYDNKCDVCGTEDDLNVHHRTYIAGRMAWEYEDEHLVCLCEHHHQIEHTPNCCETPAFKYVYDPDMRKKILVPLYPLYCQICGTPLIPGA